MFNERVDTNEKSTHNNADDAPQSLFAHFSDIYLFVFIYYIFANH